MGHRKTQTEKAIEALPMKQNSGRKVEVNIDGRHPVPWTPEREAAVLHELSKGYSITAAAARSGLHRQRVVDRCKREPAFKALVDDAIEAGTNFYEDIAREAIVDGWEDMRLDRDGNEHYYRKRDPRVLELVLKKRDHAYRDRFVAEGGTHVDHMVVEVNGGRATGIGDVLELARQLGVGLAQGVREGLDAGAARPAIPAPRDVLPDPPDG